MIDGDRQMNGAPSYDGFSRTIESPRQMLPPTGELSVQELADILGMTARGLLKKVSKERWRHRSVANPRGGGQMMLFKVHELPADVIKIVSATAEHSSGLSLDLPAAQDISEAALQKAIPNHDGMSSDTLRNPQVKKYAPVIDRALNVPQGWKRTAWVAAVARNYNISPSALRAMMTRFREGNYEALRHVKSYRGASRKWDHGAIEYSAGLLLKRGHKNWSVKSLFNQVMAEAQEKGWRTGGLRSWQNQVEKRLNTKLKAIRDGGVRALDNLLPPILRTNTDLPPFGIVVGDQHRFDRWVRDDVTDKVFRPECYIWQDLRTRLLYGGAVGKRYDRFMMGLGLWVGCRIFGAFRQIFTDNGKPERSGYIADILSDMATLGLSEAEELDGLLDLSEADSEELCCAVLKPGTHRYAIVKNAKSKMIERTNSALEAIHRDVFRLPGDSKRLTDSGEEQEVDHDEAKWLARHNKLLTYSEFRIKFFAALDYYNRRRPHQGVLKEWKWDPRPKQATPMNCLEMCYRHEEWRPIKISEEALNILFLPKKERRIDRGRIHFRTEITDLYEHPELTVLDNGESVTVRFDPVDPEWLLVFRPNGKFLCRAHPVEYSSMKDLSLAQRKIKEKAALRKAYLEEYRRLTSLAPDLREFSTAPRIESQAEAVRAAGKELEDLRAEIEVVKVPEGPLPALTGEEDRENGPDQPRIYQNETDRYFDIMDRKKGGDHITREEEEFIKQFEEDESNCALVDLMKQGQNKKAAQCGPG